MYVEFVEGLPEFDIRVCRYLPIASLTDLLRNKHACCTKSFEKATLPDKKKVANIIVKKCCKAIIDGIEDEFVSENVLPHRRTGSTTAQADICWCQFAVAQQPDHVSDECDSVADGMCVDATDEYMEATIEDDADNRYCESAASATDASN